jgi:hypothetical protein
MVVAMVDLVVEVEVELEQPMEVLVILPQLIPHKEMMVVMVIHLMVHKEDKVVAVELLQLEQILLVHLMVELVEQEHLI